MIQKIAEGFVYTNPAPHLRSRQAFHPSITRLDGRELVCTFDIGEAVESLDYATYLSRSVDGGETWELQGPIFHDDSGRRTTHTFRTSRLGGELVGIGGRFYREDPQEGLVNRANLGYVPTDLLLLRSCDGGRSWQRPEIISPPLVGPCWEIAHPVIELPSGCWLAPLSTWRGWNGELPNGEMALALIGDDRGRTWPQYGVTFDGRKSGRIHWEQSVVSLGGQRVLAISWVYDPKTGKNLPNEYSVSEDGGVTFSSPRPAGLDGQTAKLVALPDGRVLCVYRRNNPPGLWANLSRLDGQEWVNLEEQPLWGRGLNDAGMVGQGGSGDELSALRFGYPQMVVLPDGDVLLVFWRLEGWSSSIAWIKLRVR